MHVHDDVYEQRREKTCFLHICKNIGSDQLRSSCTAFFFFINLKYQASSHLLWLYSPVCVDLVGNSKDRFSLDAAHIVVLQLFSRSMAYSCRHNFE